MEHLKRIVLANGQSAGDVVMLTAAVRDLHRAYPNRFLTDVRTPYPELWIANPYVTRLELEEDGVQMIECHYPLIKKANCQPVHFLSGFSSYLSEKLSLQVQVTDFKGDMYLLNNEREWPSGLLDGLLEPDQSYWIICAGGKNDMTVKWWDSKRYQGVVNAFAGRIQFIQVGAAEDHHPELQGVIDLRGKTTLRDLIHLMAHADGVVCGVTLSMHLAAAVPMLKRAKRLRPCIVIAGGREPPHWEAYPGHQFIHTVGMLPCCQNGGCWKARTRALADGHENDSPYRLCLEVVDDIPRCMHLIKVEDVVARIAGYVDSETVWEKWKM